MKVQLPRDSDAHHWIICRCSGRMEFLTERVVDSRLICPKCGETIVARRGNPMTTYHEAELIALRERVAELERITAALARLHFRNYSEDDLRRPSDLRHLDEWLGDQP